MQVRHIESPSLSDAGPPARHGRLAEVHNFWNLHPCGAQFVDVPFATPQFFEQYAAFRYGSERHLNELVPFGEYRGKRVLEIGCGLGADGARFAHNGAIYTGIDLTEAAVDATRLHFEVRGLPGTFLIQNAERMAFEDGCFDLVYSHGVLHHTETIGSALREVHRVLRPGGRILLMLYHRHSFNYYVRILAYFRAQVIAYAVLRSILPRSWRTGDLEAHYRNYRRIGRAYFGREVFPHHCADGPECTIANSYSRAEARAMLEPFFGDLSFKLAHFPIHNTFGWVPAGLERTLASRFGWYLFIYGQKHVLPAHGTVWTGTT